MVSKKLNLTEWIARKENLSIDNTNFSHISDFTLMWAYAELKIIEKHYSVLKNKSKGKSLNIKNFCTIMSNKTTASSIQTNEYLDECYNFFKTRYTTEVDGEKYFDNLFPRKQESKKYKQPTWDIIARKDNSTHKRIQAAGIICIRIRNNLFHGTKRFQHVLCQEGLIRAATVGMLGITTSLLEISLPNEN